MYGHLGIAVSQSAIYPLKRKEDEYIGNKELNISAIKFEMLIDGPFLFPILYISPLFTAGLHRIEVQGEKLRYNFMDPIHYVNNIDTPEYVSDPKEVLARHQVEQRSAEWYKKRSNLITASDAAAALGQNPYKSRDELLLQKAGIFKDTFVVY